MRKVVLYSFWAVAAMMVFSCKKDLNVNETKAKIATLSLVAPQIDNEAATKVSFNGASTTEFVWDANDKITLFSFTKSTNDSKTYWGDFKTTAGGASALFTGEVPAHSGTSVVAAKGRYLADANLIYSSSTWRMIFNIPPTQDGTGFPYCLFVGMPVYDGSTNTFDIPSSDDVSGDVLKYRFQLRNALGVFTLPDLTYGIVEIKITCISGDSGSPYMTSYNTGAKTFGFNLQAPGNGVYKYDTTAGHWSSSVTLSKGGTEFSGNILFACYHHPASTVLQFELKNTQGKVAARRVTLSGSLSCYNRVSRFGELPFTDADFTHDNYL